LTPEDRELDPAFFLNHQPLTLFRLARARYANLSGVGAAVAPGRWNRLGVEAIYTSTEAGVPLLERLVHTPKSLIPSNLALMTLRISGNWVAADNELIDLRTDGHIWICRSLAEAKETIPAGLPFGVGRGIFAVAVPSVIVPVWNVVLYPEGRGFWEPDNTPVETADFNV
jgi:RES domain-containing protein